MPKVSVVMSVYKEPLDWLRQSVDSVLAQTYKDFEFIIVCDNPKYDECINLLKDYSEKDERVKLLFNQENIGLTKSLNKGIAIAQGEYIARMDADDESLPNRFEEELDYLEKHPEVDVCASNKRAFGKVNCFTRKTNWNMPCSFEEIKLCLLFVNPLVHPSVLMKRVIKGKNVRYDENYRIAQDYILWHDLIKSGAVINVINKVLIKYRISSSQISSKNIAQRQVCDTIQIDLLRGLKPDISKEELRLHIEVMSMTVSRTSLETKLQYLFKLSQWLKLNYGCKEYIDYMISYYALKNCIAYQRPLYYLKGYPGIKRQLTKTDFWRLLVKYYYSKVRQ